MPLLLPVSDETKKDTISALTLLSLKYLIPDSPIEKAEFYSILIRIKKIDAAT